MNPTLEQSFADWAQVAAAAALIAGAIIAVVTIRTGRKLARQETVFRYLERHDSDSVTQLFTWAAGTLVLRDGETPDAGKERYRRLSDFQQDQIWRVLNFWEEISAIYLQHLFDESIFRQTLGPFLIESWLDTHWLVNHLRQTDEGVPDLTLWSCWERVAKRLLKARVAYTRRPDSDPGAAATPRRR